MRKVTINSCWECYHSTPSYCDIGLKNLKETIPGKTGLGQGGSNRWRRISRYCLAQGKIPKWCPLPEVEEEE